MPSNRSSKAKRASASGPTELRAAQARRTPDESPVRDPAAAPVATAEDAAGRPAQREAIEQAMARQNVRLASSPGAVGPIGRTLLLIALFALVGLLGAWVLLAL